MSVYSLTSPDKDKAWANLYVNTLTAYNGINVEGGIELPPKKKKTIQFQAISPPDADPVTIDFLEVAGMVVAELSNFQHTHASPVIYNFEAIDADDYNDLKPSAANVDFPIHVNDNGTLKVGVFRVGTEIHLGSGVDDEGDLVEVTYEIC